MPITVPDRRELTNNFIAMLAGAVASPAPAKQVYDTWVPPTPATPYSVVYTLPGGYIRGSWKAPESDAGFIYQVTSVGGRRDHAEWMADTIRRTVVSRTATGAFQVNLAAPTGMVIYDRLIYENAGGVEASGEPPNQIFAVAESYLISVTPS